MVDETEQKRDFTIPASAFAGAEAAGKAYLGDRAAIEALFRTMIGEFLDRWGDVGLGDMEPEEAGARDLAEVKRVAAILRGKNQAFVPMAKFNRDDLAPFITRWTGITDDDPNMVVQGWIADILSHLHEWSREYSDDAMTEDEFRTAIEALVDESCKIALGIRPDLEL
jgi:hypothetical protein